MANRKKVSAKPTHFVTEPYMEANGFPIAAGDIIKIKGEYGTKFKFIGITTNTLTGSSWVDCYELFRGRASQFRAFKQDMVKRVPQRGKRAKRVNN